MPNNDNGTYIWDVDHNEWKNLGNFIGEQGAKGDKGDTGDTGATGPQGPAGTTPDISLSASVSNTTGTPAVTVTKGGTTAAPTFALAFSGIKGETGPQGPTGATGAQGPKGDTGDTGATGATGPKGDKGDTGATGPQGPQGLQGETGLQGPIGPMGPVGPQGQKGDKGDTGEGTLWWSTTGEFDPVETIMNIPTARIISFDVERTRTVKAGDYVILNSSNLYEVIQITTYQGTEVAQSIMVATLNGDFPPYQFAAQASIGTNDPTKAPTATATVSEHGLQRTFNFVFNNIKGQKGDTGAQGPTGATGATGAKGERGIGIPDGGTTGQMLYKKSNTNYDFGWKNIREVPSGGSSNQVLSIGRDGLTWKNRTQSYMWNDTFDGSTGIENKHFHFDLPADLRDKEITSVQAYFLWDTAVSGYNDIFAGTWYPVNGLTLTGLMTGAGYNWKQTNTQLQLTLLAGMATQIFVIGSNVISTWSNANKAAYLPNDGNGHVRLRVVAMFKEQT